MSSATREGDRASYAYKLRVPTRVSQFAQEQLDGYLLVAPQLESHDRPQTVLELLNVEQTVVPFILRANSAVLLLTRANVDWVVVGPNVEPHRIVPPEYVATREQRVELRFTDGSHIDGIVAWDATGERTRLSDFLNGTDVFFVVRARFGTLIVNKHRVRETLLAEVTPRPLEGGLGGVVTAGSTS